MQDFCNQKSTPLFVCSLGRFAVSVPLRHNANQSETSLHLLWDATNYYLTTPMWLFLSLVVHLFTSPSTFKKGHKRMILQNALTQVQKSTELCNGSMKTYCSYKYWSIKVALLMKKSSSNAKVAHCQTLCVLGLPSLHQMWLKHQWQPTWSTTKLVLSCHMRCNGFQLTMLITYFREKECSGLLRMVAMPAIWPWTTCADLKNWKMYQCSHSFQITKLLRDRQMKKRVRCHSSILNASNTLHGKKEKRQWGILWMLC